MPYDRQIPDAPIALSMMPRATTLTVTFTPQEWSVG